MANILTYNQVVDILQDIAQRHYQLNTFFLGRNWEIENNADVVYPALQVYPETVNMPQTNGEYKTVEINLNCKVIDLVAQDEANEKDIHSDTLRIAQDVINELNQHPFYQRSNAQIVGDIQLTNLEEYQDDFCGGWEFVIRLRLINNNSYCGLPFEDISGYSATGPASTGYSTSVQYLTCASVTGCTTLQNYLSQVILTSTTTGNFLSLSGGTVTGDTVFTQGLSANSFSAETIYLNNQKINLGAQHLFMYYNFF